VSHQLERQAPGFTFEQFRVLDCLILPCLLPLVRQSLSPDRIHSETEKIHTNVSITRIPKSKSHHWGWKRWYILTSKIWHRLLQRQLHTHVYCSSIQYPSHGNSQDAPLLMNALRKCGIYTQWSFTQPWRMKCYHSQVNACNRRTSFSVVLARLRRRKIVCSLSYADFRSRANIAML
jgi:hypothetical protein